MTTLNDLHDYLCGMMEGREGDPYPRIEHAHGVQNAVFAVAGGIIWVADPESIQIRRGGQGRMTNMVWFRIHDMPYCVVYKNHTIEIRQRSQQGQPVLTFSDANILTVRQSFASLRTACAHIAVALQPTR